MRRYIRQILFYIFLLNLCTYSQTPIWEFLGLENEFIQDIIVDDNNHIYTAGFDGIYKSTNNGETWELKNNGLSSVVGQHLEIDSSGNIYLAAIEGLYRTTDGGGYWTRIAQSLSNQEFSDVAIIPNGHIFISNFDGVYRSTNNGDDWIVTSFTGFGATNIGINTKDYMFFGDATLSWFGIYRSTDFGVTWERNVPLSTSSLVYLCDGTVLAGCIEFPNPSGIYKTTDNGISWVNTNTFSGVNDFLDFVLDTDGDIYVAVLGDDNGVFKSNNDGQSWLSFGMADKVVICLAIDSSGYVWVGTNQQGIYRTAGSAVPVFDIIDNSSNDFNLYQNYPNPFNTTTKIKFDLAELEFVTLNVFDVLGNKVGVLINDEKPAGSYEVIFDTFELPSGIYFYKLQVGSYSQEKKMIHLK